MNKVHYQQM